MVIFLLHCLQVAKKYQSDLKINILMKDLSDSSIIISVDLSGRGAFIMHVGIYEVAWLILKTLQHLKSIYYPICFCAYNYGKDLQKAFKINKSHKCCKAGFILIWLAQKIYSDIIRS